MLPGFGVPPEAHWEAQVDCKQFIWGVNPGNTGGEKGNDTGKGGQQTEGVNKQLLPRGPHWVTLQRLWTWTSEMSHSSGAGPANRSSGSHLS